MPAECRPFLDAVLGASEARRGWVELADYIVGQRLPARTRTTKKASIEKRTQRRRSQLVAWQLEADIELIEIETGGRKGDEDFPTRYKLDRLFDAWAEAVRLVEQSANIQRNPKKAKAEAAKKPHLSYQGIL